MRVLSINMRPHLQKKRPTPSLLQMRTGGSGLEAVRDIISNMETDDHKPRFGLESKDLKNLRLTSSAFRNAMPAGVRWQWYLSRSPLLHLLWLAHSNSITFVVDQQVWDIMGDTVSINKQRATPTAIITMIFSASSDDDPVHDARHPLNMEADVKRRLRSVEESVEIPEDTSLDTRFEVFAAFTQESLDLPFYLNIYLPNVPNAMKPQFLQIAERAATSFGMTSRPKNKTRADASYGKTNKLTESFEINLGGASSSSSHQSSVKSDHSTTLDVPYYFNLYFKESPALTYRPRRVLAGCPALE